MDAKLAPFSESAAGICGLETLLSLVLKLVDETALSMTDAVARVTTHPAQILGVEVGRLLPGAPADICVFDPTASWRVDSAGFISRGSNTPFDEGALPGIVKAVLVAGQAVSA